MRPIRTRARAMCIMRFRHRVRGSETSPTETPRKAAGVFGLGAGRCTPLSRASRVDYPAERGVWPIPSISSNAVPRTGSPSSFGTTPRQHVFLHIREKHRGVSRAGIEDVYGDGLAEHDAQIGKLLKKLDELGLSKNTIVIYTSDNGA